MSMVPVLVSGLTTHFLNYCKPACSQNDLSMISFIINYGHNLC